MHIPDNYLSPSSCLALYGIMIPIWKKAITKIKNGLTKKKMPMLGISSAFVFLIMMFNVPLPGGTSGHAVGAALIGILLGPSCAVISVTIAILIQALFFGDGGILSFGANCFNMAFVMPFIGYYVYTHIKNNFTSKKGEYVAVLLSAYLAINVAALCAGLEFGLQPLLFRDTAGAPIYCPYNFNVSIPAMVIPHLLIAGVMEAFITLGVYTYIKKMSPELIYAPENKNNNNKTIYGFLIFLILLSPLGLLAKGTAWGEWSNNEIKIRTGFVPKGIEKGFTFNAILPDYTAPSMSRGIGYILSAIAGVAFILIFFKLTYRKKVTSTNK